ncbi:protein LEAD-SENSITIVE 1-like [Salvia miltiorrhiza]|uniref:protein LEAD-SENSITIVE 1-like n=1 Tax=Salvia miltiorrhiza TaxID=226208 RepID=UPI0025AB8D9C|nr:protein LEAD-SENSITIVE 1-like [Salvia miltiorrhiza]
MGLISNKVPRRFLKPGDHIYSWRFGLVYSHHGVFRGEGQVIHFTSASSSSAGPRRRGSCSACELLEHSDRHSGVTVSCLDCFLRSGWLCRYEYGVSNAAHALRRRGTCNTAESGPVEVVLERAEALLAQNSFGEYHLLENNCEDFATFCKTGQRCNRNGTSRRYGQASVFTLPSRRRRSTKIAARDEGK